MAGKKAVLFLRGLNVGGRHKVTMADLRDVLDDLGLGPSSTHLQSGNAVICGRPGPKTDKMVAEALAAEFEFDVPAVSRSAADLAAVVEANPFADQAEADPQSVHVLFLFDRPKANLVDAIGPDRWPDAAWEVVGKEMFVHYREGSAGSKLTVDDVERQLGVGATARNWNTVTAMAEKVPG